MDPDLILIFGFVLLIASLAMVTAHLIHRREITHQERKLELKARIAEANAMEKRAEGLGDKSLESRVRVLERIATDKGSDLAAMIEDLRDLPVDDAESTQ